ncbi:MAG: phospho-N-acetylmuramoyl-pentapeptide-transferase [Deltaproteobacteria bacterium]|nr:MAG: phospho-N-acetylmuramoyl-pentapeptide-transferase [Deltaproteobacteria bacterium]PIE72966.1 MAG: phospho-N-acetylmuramoyl-pentapeptide-transferase [Deltaproteobacteria bacterium]
MLYYFLYPLHTSLSVFNVFKYITFRSIGAALTAFVLVICFGPLFIRSMRSFGVGQVVRKDVPDHEGKRGTPTMGGVLIVAAVSAATLLWARLDNLFVWLCLFITVSYSAIGAIDDIKKLKKNNSDGLGFKGKLLLQSVGALAFVCVLYWAPGFDGHLSFPFVKSFRPDIGAYYIPFTVLVVVGASNAVNLTDGLDGLAAGPTIVTTAVYLLFSYLAGNAVLSGYLHIPNVPGCGELTIFCGTIFGACLGFLWFNAHPAQLFMGDVGSLPLGGALGGIAIITKQEFLLVIVGGIFVMEAVSVILQVGYFKWSKGKRLFRMAPFHHHFERKGWHENKVVVRFWIISIMLALVALATLKLR